LITTALEFAGYPVARNVGVVRLGLWLAMSREPLQTWFGGNIAVYTNFCKRTRAAMKN
jgi:hypothetical protein